MRGLFGPDVSSERPYPHVFEYAPQGEQRQFVRICLSADGALRYTEWSSSRPPKQIGQRPVLSAPNRERTRNQEMEIVQFDNDPEIFERASVLFEKTVRGLRERMPWAEFHHVGSTAVPGSLTKGDLDVAVRVPADRFDEAEALLASAFARNTGSDQTNDFAAFEDRDVQPHLGIQLVAKGSEADNFHTWVERLRADDLLRSQYDELKREHHGGEMTRYRAAKAAFIRQRIDR